MNEPRPFIQTNRMSVASLVLGACSLVTVIIPFLNIIILLMGPLGMVLGFLATRQIKRNPDEMKGGWQALTGILLNLVSTLLVVAMYGFVLMMI
ncbi:hypothetical protein CIG75_04905 [Tumebacillus algifaecis]|uniref:DUF4190 domain-containing protein n=1 Tax=Tumebacillus algifaecis TaxID=1214604 RepID=A0A223CZ88_9BACL|nr:DUF4190 domain-containing protein [Tumebacillus algifaecis]ASS74387.1 hypothetical protein CIG75_04905 [Tumebacillus algifaecis]